jgi:hypothetical protein
MTWVRLKNRTTKMGRHFVEVEQRDGQLLLPMFAHARERVPMRTHMWPAHLRLLDGGK